MTSTVFDENQFSCIRGSLEFQRHKMMEFLDERGAVYRICGGYPRDLYYGVTPRDVDFWVMSWDDDLLQAIRGNFSVDVEFDGYDENDEDPESDSERGISRVFKIGAVDVIILDEEYNFTSASEIVSTFDFNFNQFTLRTKDGSLEPVYLGEGMPPVGLPELENIRNVSADRHCRMIEKAREAFHVWRNR